MKKTDWLVILFLACTLAQLACIGRQPSQQGTWSGQDGYKTKVTDQMGFSPQNPNHG